MEEDNKKKLSGFERFLYLALIPLIFTVVLAGTGLFLMNHGKGESFASTVVNAGKSAVSMVQKVTKGNQPAVPAATASASPQPSPAVPGQPAQNGGQAASAPPAGTAAAGAPSAGTGAPAGSGGTAPSSGTGTAAAAQTGASPQPSPAADFKKKTDEMASQFAKMPASKAAPILTNMTVKNAVFTMIGMKAQQRADVLAKMDPKQAAVISKELENFPPGGTSDPEQLQKQFDSLPDTPQPMEEAAKTYSQMPAQTAAVLIGELMKSDQKKAIGIMSRLDASTRAQILSAMSSNPKDPASIKNAATLSQMLVNS